MSFKRCPGSSAFMQPKIEVVPCPDCGSDVEIWSDEADGKCPSCALSVVRMSTQSCVDWCRYAEECLGEEKYKQYNSMKSSMRKQALLKAMDDYFGDDKKRRRHARTVVSFAEQILRTESTADPNVVIASAVLHDIGIRNAEHKHGSSSPGHQEQEGPPVARRILEELGYPEGFIKEVCGIIGHHHHPTGDDSSNFGILYDADLITNTIEEKRHLKPDFSSDQLLNACLTDSGREVAKRNLP